MRRILLIVCGFLFLLLWAAQAHPYLNVANDAGRYMVLGESLAQSGELRLLNDPQKPPDTLYPPGFPALIAFWLLLTGRDPGGVVLLVKITQAALLIGSLPFLYRLLERARLPDRYIAAALLAFALCPAAAAYANEVMSEIPFMVLCLMSVALVERDTRCEPEEEPLPSPTLLVLALVCAAGAFLVRTAGIALLLAQVVWFWRRFGWKWGVAAFGVTMLLVGGWQWRNQRVLRGAPPGVHYATYFDQFSLRDPLQPGAGRIQMNAKGLLLRASEGLPAYFGMVPRAPLLSMSRFTPWFFLFYIVAVPFALLTFAGFVVGWRRGLHLSCGFAGAFWLLAAMWPWRDPRFLVPLLPFIFLFLFLGVEWVSEELAKRAGTRLSSVVQAIAASALLTYCGYVHYTTILRENRPTLAQYNLGRTKAEGGFYAACDWLKRSAPPDSRVMGRPAYLLHLYSGHPTTQIEPNSNPRVQEIAYMQKRGVRFLVQDAWDWSHTEDYLGPYLREYATAWRLVWQDPAGSGARIWERITPMPGQSS